MRGRGRENRLGLREEEDRWRLMVVLGGGGLLGGGDGDVPVWGVGRLGMLGPVALLVSGLACARGLCFGSAWGFCLSLGSWSLLSGPAVTVARRLILAFPRSLANREWCFLVDDC